VAIGAGVILAAIAVAIIIVIRTGRPERHRLFRETERTAVAPTAIPPVEQWSSTFAALAPDDLAALLQRIRSVDPQRYAAWSLGYLHARALIEDNELDDAATALAPFLAAENPFRPLALYHQSEIEAGRGNEAEASRLRQDLILGHPKYQYRQEAIDEEIEYLAALEEAGPLADFAARVTPSLETRARRELNARLVEARLRGGQTGPAVALALSILDGDTGDDAAGRAARAIDRPEIVRGLTPEQQALLGETFASHRVYGRAAALLSAAIPRLPARADELRFALGRAHFGAEDYAEAERIYLSSSKLTRDNRWKATFFWHASRAAQLRGDDAAAERLMTSAIAVKGHFPATSAALTQRIRTRVKQRRFGDAASDLALLRRAAPNDRATVEGALALALGHLGAGNHAAATALLNSVPASRLDAYDRPEFDYWRARAVETSDVEAAFAAYLGVLRATTPAHFSYFARDRLDSPSMSGRLSAALERREAEVAKLTAAGDFTTAKRLQTDRILLSSTDHAAEIRILAGIYSQIPAYREILELKPEPLPQFPLPDDADRASLLMAMSLYDEATDEIRERWPLRDVRSALTQSMALNRGGESRASIHAVEVLMRSVPDDFHPDLLPLEVRQLLYPRYFYGAIARDSERFGADPRLVLSIMREESRFNPRAKSAAAARGLLQFIITTARDIGRNIGLVDLSPEDLYDPRVIISLGAKYVAELLAEFEGNRYRAVAAYNAGPNQVKLWTRMAPAPGDDYFFSAVNFDETKHYVRKVMNSYRRYGEIYDRTPPAGGVTIEP
jgi:soluble lytic murein transglycosylase-like protein